MHKIHIVFIFLCLYFICFFIFLKICECLKYEDYIRKYGNGNPWAKGPYIGIIDRKIIFKSSVFS